MPRVPTLDRQVQTGPLPGVRVAGNATPEAFGAQDARDRQRFGQALQSAGGKAVDAAVFLANKLRQEDTVAKEAAARTHAVKYMQEAMALRSGLFTREGESATKVYEDGVNELENLRKKYESNIESDKVRRLFNEGITGFVKQESSNYSNFQTESVKKFQAQSYEASKLSYIQRAVANRTKPEEVMENASLMEQEVRRLEELKGNTGKVVDQAVLDATTQLHMEVSRAFSNDQDGGLTSQQAALAHWESNEDSINPLVFEEFGKQLKESAFNAQVTDEADLILAEGGTMTEMRDKVKKKFSKDTKMRDQVLEKLRYQVESNDQAKLYDQKKEVQEALEVYYNNPDMPLLPNDPIHIRTAVENLKAEQLKARKGIIDEVQKANEADFSMRLATMYPDEILALPDANTLHNERGLSYGYIQNTISKAVAEAKDAPVRPFGVSWAEVNGTLEQFGLGEDALEVNKEGKFLYPERAVARQHVMDQAMIEFKANVNGVYNLKTPSERIARLSQLARPVMTEVSHDVVRGIQAELAGVEYYATREDFLHNAQTSLRRIGAFGVSLDQYVYDEDQNAWVNTDPAQRKYVFDRFGYYIEDQTTKDQILRNIAIEKRRKELERAMALAGVYDATIGAASGVVEGLGKTNVGRTPEEQSAIIQRNLRQASRRSAIFRIP